MATDDALIQMFYDIDKDKSGEIDCEELRNYLRSKAYDEIFIVRFLKAFDNDRDGRITFQEFSKSLHKIPHTQKLYSTWYHVLQEIDTNQNGYISMDELCAYLANKSNAEPINFKQIQAFVREYDLDGDGKLNYHEFLDYILDSAELDTQK